MERTLLKVEFFFLVSAKGNTLLARNYSMQYQMHDDSSLKPKKECGKGRAARKREFSMNDVATLFWDAVRAGGTRGVERGPILFDPIHNLTFFFLPFTHTDTRSGGSLRQARGSKNGRTKRGVNRVERENRVGYVVAATRYNTCPSLMLEALNRVKDCFDDLLGLILDERALSHNFTLLYELVDHLFDAGYIQHIDTALLAEVLANSEQTPMLGFGSHSQSHHSRPPSLRALGLSGLGPLSPRTLNLRHLGVNGGKQSERGKRKAHTPMESAHKSVLDSATPSMAHSQSRERDEVFLDVIERVDVIFNHKGLRLSPFHLSFSCVLFLTRLFVRFCVSPLSLTRLVFVVPSFSRLFSFISLLSPLTLSVCTLWRRRVRQKRDLWRDSSEVLSSLPSSSRTPPPKRPSPLLSLFSLLSLILFPSPLLCALQRVCGRSREPRRVSVLL